MSLNGSHQKNNQQFEQHNGFDFPFTTAADIRMLILDVDGVMTNGSIIMDQHGDEWKAFNVRDGHGIKMLQRANIKIAIITGRTSKVVAARAGDLGIEYVIQEGTLGLMHAVKRFDPDRGFRLKTYASYWIRASIHDFILRSWSIVKMGTNKLQRRIFAGLQKAECAIAALEGRNLKEIAEQHGTSGESYQAIAASFLRRDFSIDSDNGDEGHVLELPAPDDTPEQHLAEKDWTAYAKQQLKQAMDTLSDRDRYIIRQRRLMDPPATLKELSVELGVSIERVRQLEARAMKKMGEACADVPFEG